MPKICLVLEYNGTAFHGWQVQPGLRTVQGELHRVLEMVLREKIPRLTAAGRTDAGVHARCQVVTFSVEKAPDLFSIGRSVGGLFRGEISVQAATFVPEDFHPTYDARAKRYVYTILNRTAPLTLDQNKAWHICHSLDLKRMHREAARLLGSHDFKSFQGQKCAAKNTERVIYESKLQEDPPYLYYHIVGSGFLKHMVRNIVGSLVGFGLGKLKYESILELIELRDRRKAWLTAPAAGLCLDWVEY